MRTLYFMVTFAILFALLFVANCFQHGEIVDSLTSLDDQNIIRSSVLKKSPSHRVKHRNDEDGGTDENNDAEDDDTEESDDDKLIYVCGRIKSRSDCHFLICSQSLVYRSSL